MIKTIARFSGYLHAAATLKMVVLAFIAHIVFAMIIIPKSQYLIDASQTHTILEWRFGYSSLQIHELFEEIGINGRKAYLLYVLVIDNLYALIYSISFSLLLSLFFRNSFSKTHYIQYFNCFPFLVGFSDILENVSVSSLIFMHPIESIITGKLASFFSLVKWGCTIYNLLLLMTGMFAWLMKSLLLRKK